MPAIVVLLTLLVPTFVGAQTADAAPSTPKSTKYLRLVRDSAGTAAALETAIVRFAPRDARRGGPTVDLVGAVHIADRAYYEQLNRLFEDYDVVLYELVAPEGTKVPEGGKGRATNPLSAVQLGLKDLLALEFQLHRIRYSRPNMMHADMSPEQFVQSMKDRNESIFSMFLRMMGYALAKQSSNPSSTSDMDLLMALFDKNRALALKRIMAEQFEDMEGSLLAMEGPQGSTLIRQRNKVALEVLRKQLAAGRKRIAIFYGAGHMPNMEQQLRDDFGMVPVSTRWLTAWDMKGAGKPKK